MKTEYDRWISKVNKGTDECCWEWQGATYRHGYGHFRRKVDGSWKMYKAHRYSYEVFKNENQMLSKDQLVCHSCDNPKCVNPSHLFVGTTYDNVQDKMRKGRQRHGHKQGHRVLSETDVIKIRSDYASGILTMKEVADMNNTSASQVERIVNFKIHRKVGTEN